MLQQLQAMLPAIVTPQRAGMIVLGQAFIAWRFLSLKMLLVLGAPGSGLHQAVRRRVQGRGRWREGRNLRPAARACRR